MLFPESSRSGLLKRSRANLRASYTQERATFAQQDGQRARQLHEQPFCASFSGVLARQQRSTATPRPSPRSSLVRHDSARVTQGTKVPSPASLRFFVQRELLITRVHDRQRRRRVASHPTATPPSRDAGEIHL